MRVRYTVALAVGGLAAVGGIVAVTLPRFAPRFSTPELMVMLLGFLALVQGIRYGMESRDEDEPFETPDPELVEPMPVPGDEFDAQLLRTVGRGRTARDNKDDVEQRLTEVAIDVFVWKDRCTPAEARARLDEGTWTDDPYAAAFLGGPEVTGLTTRERLRQTLSSVPRFQRRARRTADALARYAGLETEVES